MPPRTKETIDEQNSKAQQRPDPMQVAAQRFGATINAAVDKAAATLASAVKPTTTPAAATPAPAEAKVETAEPRKGEVVEAEAVVVDDDKGGTKKGDTQPMRMIRPPMDEHIYREGTAWCVRVDLYPEWATYAENTLRLSMSVWINRAREPKRYAIVGRKRAFGLIGFFREQEDIFEILNELEAYNPY